MNKARRYNSGKIRMELIPASFEKELAKVYTIGAEKYTVKDEEGNIIDDGADNWKKGLDWKSVLGSVCRHINKFKDGEDFDYDYPEELLERYGPTYHLANAAWGLSVLIDYYKTHPELDNRKPKEYKTPRIALDIDDVLAQWINVWCEKHGCKEPTSWYFDRAIKEKFDTMKYDGSLDDFYMSLPVLTKPEDIPFEPVVYVTARPVDSKVTEAWLDMHGFPAAPVETVGTGGSKVDILKKYNADIFVDDNYYNFEEINKAGICCFLFDKLHNQKFQVGYRRIKSLRELKFV